MSIPELLVVVERTQLSAAWWASWRVGSRTVGRSSIREHAGPGVRGVLGLVRAAARACGVLKSRKPVLTGFFSLYARSPAKNTTADSVSDTPA
ncbi:MAG TPA: hypothetical protein VK280_04015 [Streptosporangiaceae bacterium]|nr:hypothetical protein [Streptosporangiaceae bacterium]